MSSGPSRPGAPDDRADLSADLSADRARRARLAVLAVFALNALVFATWVSRIPAVRDELGLSNAGIGLMLLSTSVGAMVALPASGVLALRLGAASTVRSAAAVCTLGLALAGLTGTVPLLVLGLFLMGLGSAAWDVVMNVEGAEVERRLGRAVMPQLHGAWSVGSVTGAAGGVLANLLQVPTAVHLVVVAVAALALTTACCGWFLPVASSWSADGWPPAGAGRHPLRAWLEPRTVAVGLLVLTFAFTEGAANDWLAVAVVDAFHVENEVGVVTFAIFTAAMTTGRFLGSGLLDRFGRALVLRVTAVLAMVGLLLVIVGSSLPLVMAGAFGWGLGACLGFPVGMSAASDDPAHAAARVGVVSSLGYAAFLVGPPAVGFLAEQVGTRQSLWVVLAVLVAALALAGSAAPRTERTQP